MQSQRAESESRTVAGWAVMSYKLSFWDGAWRLNWKYNV